MKGEYEALKEKFDAMLPFAIERINKVPKLHTYLPIINNGGDGKIYTQLKDYIMEETRHPEATVRWNMNWMKNHGLISTGTKETQGTPTRVTKKGKIVLKYLNGKKFVNPI